MVASLLLQIILICHPNFLAFHMLPNLSKYLFVNPFKNRETLLLSGISEGLTKHKLIKMIKIALRWCFLGVCDQYWQEQNKTMNSYIIHRFQIQFNVKNYHSLNLFFCLYIMRTSTSFRIENNILCKQSNNSYFFLLYH